MVNPVPILIFMMALLLVGLPYSWFLSRQQRAKFAWVIFFASILPTSGAILLVCGDLYSDYVF